MKSAQIFWGWGASLLFLALALLLAWWYPFGRPWLIVGACSYWIVLLRCPSCWLFLLPIFLSIINLAPWSGWVLFDDFDIFAAVTVSSALRPFVGLDEKPASESRWMWFALAAMGIVWIAGCFRSLSLPSLAADAFGTYETSWNSLRMVKGFLWASLLIPAIRSDLSKAEGWRFFSRGVCTALFFQVLAVMWERGVVHDLVHATSRYDALSSLLNFSTAYRTTGLFSEMHLGGAAGDGFLLLVWPLAAVLALDSRENKWWRGFAAFSALGGLYAVVVTFTRATYVSIALGAMVIAAMGLLKSRKQISLKAFLWWAGSAIVGFILFFFLFRRGGLIALFAAAIAVAGGIAATKSESSFPGRFRFMGGGIVSLAGIMLMARAFMTSRWIENSLGVALWTSIIAVILLAVSGYVLVSRRPSGISRSVFVGCALSIIAAYCIAIPAIGGYRMTERFLTASRDSKSRIQHWQDVMDAMGRAPKAVLFGRGLGTFPGLYRKVKEKKEGPPFSIQKEDGNSFIRLQGTPYLIVGQRVPLRPHTSYLFSALVRANGKKSGLPVKIEHRNILLEEYNYHKTSDVKFDGSADGRWIPVQTVISTDEIGAGYWYEAWPTVLELGCGWEGERLDVDDVSLIAPDGKELIENGSFYRGWARWFQYSDHEHLAWHVKNLYLNIYFDLGIVGVVLFLVLSGVGCARCIRFALNGEWCGAALGGSLAGFLAFGLVESPIDAPRICFLFFMILFAAIVMPAHKYK